MCSKEMPRGARHKRSRPSVTFLASTHLTEDVGTKLVTKAEGQGMSMAVYIRRLILRDLGLLEETT